MTSTCDIIVQGGGFAGLSFALLAAQSGQRVIVIDAQTAPQRTDQSRDIRTVAISAGSRAILERAGAWSAYEFSKCPITAIQILDGDGPDVFLDFDVAEVEGDAFGHIVDNVDLRRALIDAAAQAPNIEHWMEDTLAEWRIEGDTVYASTRTGREITGKLLVGADGRFSDIRKQAGLAQFGWSYGEAALVTTIGHANPHDHIAIERFRDTGPFAVLPMDDAPDGMHRSAIVWTLREGDPRLKGGGDVQADIQSLLPGLYGAITWMGKTQSFPLALKQSYSMIGERLALVADAGHVIHPIAGQGLNVGLRDVAELADLMAGVNDPGAPEILKAYDRMRRADVVTMSIFTDKLNALFGTKFAPLRMARRFGLKLVARTPALKRFFMNRAMGY